MIEQLKKDYLLSSYNIFSDRVLAMSFRRVSMLRFYLVFLSILLIFLVLSASLSTEVLIVKNMVLCSVPLIGMFLAFLWLKNIGDYKQIAKSCYINLKNIENELTCICDISNDVEKFKFFSAEEKIKQEKKYFMLHNDKDYVLKLIKSDHLLSTMFELIFLIIFLFNFKAYVEAEVYNSLSILIMITICSLITLFYAILLKFYIIESMDQTKKE